MWMGCKVFKDVVAVRQVCCVVVHIGDVTCGSRQMVDKAEGGGATQIYGGI
jgi:hypothetical protein